MAKVIISGINDFGLESNGALNIQFDCVLIGPDVPGSFIKMTGITAVVPIPFVLSTLAANVRSAVQGRATGYGVTVDSPGIIVPTFQSI